MSLFNKPHTVTVLIADETATPGKPTFTSGGTIDGQITPKKFAAMVNDTGLDLKRPHKFLCDLGNESLLIVGNRLVYGSRKFAIMTPAGIHDAGNAADHDVVWLEELQFA